MAKGKKGGAPQGAIKRKAYYSDSSDDDSHVNFKQAVPLASLENAPVRDFTGEAAAKPAPKAKKNKANKKTKSDKPVYIANEPAPSKKQAVPGESLEQRKIKTMQQKAIRRSCGASFGREKHAL
ncbi:LOW QUALITY PROTEIN: hypothetical protein SPRG_17122 [Saprolegnia parasitica CBS 223.65]|uniref:Uncharacterized protein n=1 Tax=Saprolegnia parasitica (strain CBS 223.65) TaxID=695850 RepID=A0A067BRQ9_SAPPC|nr:LOW QUALITY PROTEIN: hypothetical protein SPRG_17122 [Saprolegnia parasitica CBS 223.65]KDO17352.1 LOW QUALITY PROTEIN: hypothetical protein SPRG_17122 [Saprolegnia parasitica CBS 223.65]|eukprot:XP_012211939.1 LOW QUALITY PROTEIN: hypothetical protein SPRG_17122 [Saprolegnia parasitica CBS 223.65]